MDVPTTARFPAMTLAPEPYLEPAPTHSIPSPSCALSRTPSLSLSRSAHAPVELRRSSTVVLWPSSSVCRIRCLGELRPFASNAGHSLVCPQPLYFARSALTGVLPVQLKPHHRRPKASLRPRRCSGAPEFPLQVRPPPCPYFPICCHVPRVIAHRSKSAASWSAPSGAPSLVSCPRSCPSCHLEPSCALPSVPWPPARPRPCLRRTSTVGASGATAGGHGTLTVLVVGSRVSIRDLVV
jgi:hypothetical protein